ncbi:MAG: hypothetical protein ACLUOD_06965 [[Clostridium] innocuum]
MVHKKTGPWLSKCQDMLILYAASLGSWVENRAALVVVYNK